MNDSIYFVSISAATAFLINFYQPSSMFEPDGSPREFSLTKSNDHTTILPWYVASLGIGYILFRVTSNNLI